jgi:hypothetical protein
VQSAASVLSFEEFKQLKRENEMLRREFEKMRGETNNGGASSKNKTEFGHSTATAVISNKMKSKPGFSGQIIGKAKRVGQVQKVRSSKGSNGSKGVSSDAQQEATNTQKQLKKSAEEEAARQMAALDAITSAFDNIDACKAVSRMSKEGRVAQKSSDENTNTTNLPQPSSDSGLFPDILGKNKFIVTQHNIPTSMSTLTEDSKRRYMTGHDQKLGKPASKVKEQVSRTSSTIATTITHTTQLVAPKIAGATKVVAENIAEATKVAKVLSQEVADMTAKTPAKSNRSKQQATNEAYGGIMPDGRYADYIHDPDYKVELTPPHTRTPAKSKTPYEYLTDPSTPHCLRGAMAAGICSLPEDHPSHPEYLPRGIPRTIDVSEDWEKMAGFVPVTAAASKLRDSTAMSTARTTFDTNVLPFAECDGKPIDMDATLQGSVDDHVEGPPELESADEGDGESDPRNASMWVAVPADEDLEEEDTIMNLGDVIVDYQHEEHGKDPEFCSVADSSPEEIASPISCGTYHIGEVQGVSFEDVSSPEAKVASLENESLENCALVETVDSDEESGVYEDCDNSVRQENDGEIASAASQNDENKENLPFETPFSVTNSEGPLTFNAEFKDVDKRVLFDENESQDIVEPTNQLYTDTQGDSPAMSKEVKPARHVVAKVENPRYSTDWLYEEDNMPANKAESGKRQLKGRMLLLRLGKKISKVKSKGKNVLRQVFVLPMRGSKSKVPALANEEVDSNDALAYHASHALPNSPSSISVASIASSLISSGSCTKRIIGAVPVYQNHSNPPLGLPYGAINYNRSATDSTVEDDALPPPPSYIHKPEGDSSDNPEEDAVSYIAAAMNPESHSEECLAILDKVVNSSGEIIVSSEDDVASIMATINAQEDGEDEDGDESSVFLVVAPNEDEEGSYRVISGFDENATPVCVKDIMDHLGEDESAVASDIHPNNLTGLFTDKNKNISIVEAEKGFVLTPVASASNNISDVFRQSMDGVVTGKPAPKIRRSTGTPIIDPAPGNTAALPKLLPGPSAESEDEDETLIFHDGCTVKQASTFGDNTIATAATEPVQVNEDSIDKQTAEERRPTETPAPKHETANQAVLETPHLSPDGPSYSKQAATNGSFLFSESNMGRAGPRIRAMERAALKQGNETSSLTMLPISKAKNVASKDASAIMSRLSYSSSASDAKSSKSQASSSPMPLIAIQPTVELKKSFDDLVRVEIQKKPVMSSMTEPRQFSFKTTLHKFDDSSPSCTAEKTKIIDEFATPLVTNCTEKKRYPTTPFPNDLSVGENVDSPLYPETHSTVSPACSTTSRSSHKKSSPKQKCIPKSALKTKKGLVKDRIIDIQQRMEGSSAVTGVNGRLKKNHSYKLKNPRRMTNGEKVLAPRKAVLQNPIFVVRSVPIGIAKSYSKDEVDSTTSSRTWAGTSTSNGRSKSFGGEANDDKSASAYASKYTLDSKVVSNSSSPSNESISTSVSESSDCDPFNTLLGKLSIDEDDESHSGSDLDELSKGKENANHSDLLPFKSGAFVKPTDINQHDKRIEYTSTNQPLSPVQPRTWRSLAAAAAQKKASSRSVTGKCALRHD